MYYEKVPINNCFVKKNKIYNSVAQKGTFLTKMYATFIYKNVINPYLLIKISYKSFLFHTKKLRNITALFIVL